jgi:hypothetical protein
MSKQKYIIKGYYRRALIMYRATKVRIYPTQEQTELLDKQFEQCGSRTIKPCISARTGTKARCIAE